MNMNEAKIRLTSVTEENWIEVASLTVNDELKKEHHYDHVEVCVDKEDAPALRVYEKCGFVDSGFIDEDLPDSVNLICRF